MEVHFVGKVLVIIFEQQNIGSWTLLKHRIEIQTESHDTLLTSTIT